MAVSLREPGRNKMRRILMTASLALLAGTASAQETSVVNAGTPAPDCTARVNYDRNADLPGYRDPAGICQPFMPLNQLVPDSYAGDFYTAEFTDAKIRERWLACKADEACAAAARKGAKGFARVETRETGTVGTKGRIDPEGAVDLADIRRPADFGKAPYGEPIASADDEAFVVEFTAPRDAYERVHLKTDGEIKLRGWYIRGDGIPSGNGGGQRALVVMNNGGGNEITALDDPNSAPVTRDETSGKYVLNEKPDGLSEEPGMRHWRGFAHAFHEAGFDVLVTDRRGNGLSGGQNGFNTAEQANDMVREFEQLASGEGMRAMGPDGKTLEGAPAASAIMDGADIAAMPIVLMGYSRGSYAVAYAMQKNFVETCDRDMPDGACGPALGRANIKGAILYGPNAGGLGTRVKGHDMIEAALREEFSTTYYPDGEVAAGVAQWPALQIVKGTWDYVEGLEGSLGALDRAKGLKDIFVFHGPHQLATQATENMTLAGKRMAAFALAAAKGDTRMEGAAVPADLRSLVLSAPPHWDTTTKPSDAP
jgi:pimeloyl-ACP methyl ester carboxylesterase